MIRVGVGGWTYEPWRGTFYSPGLAHAKELEYASRRLTTIEINSTYYGSQKAETFARWRDATPNGFVFSVKGSRFVTNRRVLAEAGPAIDRFFATGVMALREKLGPINWQFMPTKRYERSDFEKFLNLLPREVCGRRIRHAVEVRHESFQVAGFIALLRTYDVAVVVTDHPAFPRISDITAPFVYARLQRCSEEVETGYTRETLEEWGERARGWSEGGVAEDLPRLLPPEEHAPNSRDVFLYMINGFKPRAPAAAMALMERLSSQ
jgi:uncharacterized protein YecE (DUF72 family)